MYHKGDQVEGCMIRVLVGSTVHHTVFIRQGLEVSSLLTNYNRILNLCSNNADIVMLEVHATATFGKYDYGCWKCTDPDGKIHRILDDNVFVYDDLMSYGLGTHLLYILTDHLVRLSGDEIPSSLRIEYTKLTGDFNKVSVRKIIGTVLNEGKELPSFYKLEEGNVVKVYIDNAFYTSYIGPLNDASSYEVKAKYPEQIGNRVDVTVNRVMFQTREEEIIYEELATREIGKISKHRFLQGKELGYQQELIYAKVCKEVFGDKNEHIANIITVLVDGNEWCRYATVVGGEFDKSAILRAPLLERISNRVKVEVIQDSISYTFGKYETKSGLVVDTGNYFGSLPKLISYLDNLHFNLKEYIKNEVLRWVVESTDIDREDVARLRDVIKTKYDLREVIPDLENEPVVDKGRLNAAIRAKIAEGKGSKLNTGRAGQMSVFSQNINCPKYNGFVIMKEDSDRVICLVGDASQLDETILIVEKLTGSSKKISGFVTEYSVAMDNKDYCYHANTDPGSKVIVPGSYFVSKGLPREAIMKLVEQSLREIERDED